MDSNNINSTTKFAAYTAIGGAVCMFIGAAFWGATGTDLWAALNKHDLAGYLTATGEVKTLLVANSTFWIIGVLVLGMAGTLLADLCGGRRALAQAAMVCFRTAVPLAIISFIAMLAIVVQLAPDTSATAVAIAEVAGWIGARADDIATALLIGAGPFFISLAGRGDWLPAWLARWGMLAGFAGLLAVAVIYIPALTSLGFLIIPVGLGWMIAAGIVRTANITPDYDTGIGAWDQDSFIARFKEYADSTQNRIYVSQDGDKDMPWLLFAGMTVEDLTAIYKYLRSVPPVRHSVERYPN